MSARSRLAAAAAACSATTFLLLYRGAPTAFDEWLALPIALETAHPGTYSPGDVLVQESVRGPFHLYKAASVLWTLGLNVDVTWYVLLILSLIAFFLVVWRLGAVLGLDERERAVLVLAIAASPIYRGTLHWSAQPMLSFITASVAVPIALLAVTAALKDQLRTALLLAALTFDLHPSAGLCAGLAALTVVRGSMSVGALRSAWLPAIIVALPNMLYLAGHLPAPSAGNGEALWDVHRFFGYHTFVEDHADGYPWYALALAVALAGGTASEQAQRARKVVIVLSALAISWIALMNIAPIPSLLPLYLIRASWLVKPIVMGLAVMAVARHRFAGRYAFAAPFLGVFAVAYPDRMIAEGALAILLGIMLRHSANRWRAAIGIAGWTTGLTLLLSIFAQHARVLDPVTEATLPLRWMALAVGGLGAVVLLLTPPEAAPASAARSSRALVIAAIALPVVAVVFAKPFGRGWLPDSPARISLQVRLTQPMPKEAGVMRWAREQTPQRSLFAVPPVENRWVRFRIAAQRGQYTSVHDINQLMYVRKNVFTAVERLRTLGVMVRGLHRFDPRPYLRPSCTRLRRLARDGVDYYVLPSEGRVPNGSVVPYRDDSYRVIDVKRTVIVCAPEVD